MELLDKVKEHLELTRGCNYFFEFDESEKDQYNQVPKLLDQDYGFIDILLDQNDLTKLTDGYDESYPYGKYAFVHDNFKRLILDKLNIEYTDEDLFDFIFERLVKKSTNVTNKSYLRLHVMADSITDEYVQMVINRYIISKTFTVFLYKSKELLTYYNGSADPLIYTHDYCSEASSKYTRKRDMRIERFEKRYGKH